MQSEGKSEHDDDDDSDDYAESDDCDALRTPRKKKPASSKNKRAGQASSSNSGGSGAKRLKKASDLAFYAITETKTPGSSGRASTGQTGGQSLGSPVGTPSARSSPHSGAHSMMGLSSPISSPPPKASSGTPLPEGVLGTGRHKHHSFDWLYKNRADGNRRKSDHPLYNPRTLHVPPSFLKKETPAMVQWWKFKSENMDTVLFFKVRFVTCLLLLILSRPLHPQFFEAERRTYVVYSSCVIGNARLFKQSRCQPTSNRPCISFAGRQVLRAVSRRRRHRDAGA